MRAIGYYRTTNGEEEDHAEQLRKRFKDYCERYLHQQAAIFCDEIGSNETVKVAEGGDGLNADLPDAGEGVHVNGSIHANGNSHAPVNAHDNAYTNGNRPHAKPFPEFSRMLDYIISSGNTYLVVVPDTMHLGADVEEVVRSIIEIEATGCKVICEDEDLPDPLQNALASLSSAGVSKTRSERIKDSMRNRALHGKVLGKPPFGYRNSGDGTLEVVEEEAVTVRRIFDKYIDEGLGLRLIAQHLNERGIKTRRGGNWNMVTIRDILKNPTYTGTYYRFGLRLPRSHEAIISSKTYRQAQDQTKAKRPSTRTVNTEPFLLSGLAECGYCGNKMMGVTRRQSWKRRDGRSSRGIYRYYQCQGRNNQSICGYHTWRVGVLESTVLEQVRGILDDAPAVDTQSADLNRARLQTMLDKRVKNAERRFLVGLKGAARGEFGLGAVHTYLKQLDNARTNAASWNRDWDDRETIDKWDTLTFEVQQAFLYMHISKIVVRDDSAEVIT
ncbi:MAG: recombinase family protein [Chloroflexi bacterium]|nr:recombinase family protein [Chloroflexota bacterium]